MAALIYRKRDNQRRKVYTWEQAFRKVADSNVSYFTPSEARAFAQAEWNRWYPNMRCPKLVVSSRKTRFSSFYSRGWEIRMAASWGCVKSAILHELAHAVTWHYCTVAPGDRVWYDQHGPDFVSVFSVMLSRHFGANVETIRKDMRNARIRCNASYCQAFNQETIAATQQ